MGYPALSFSGILAIWQSGNQGKKQAIKRYCLTPPAVPDQPQGSFRACALCHPALSVSASWRSNNQTMIRQTMFYNHRRNPKSTSKTA
jgi:hypothetical protein